MVRRSGTAVPESGPVSVRVDGRRLRVTNLDKVLYPADGFSKAEVIDYYTRIAPVLLPHLAGRPVTFRRYPDGVDGGSFFEKDVSRHAPDWVRTMRLPTPGSGKGSETADFAMIDDLPSLVWAANLAAIELHVPQWTVGPRGGRRAPDLVVFDLDPGEPAGLVHCCRVAELIREVLAEDGLTGYPKTSGAKGLQLYVPVAVADAERTSRYARAVAQRLAREHPDHVLAVMAKARRAGKVLIDWSQNNPAKTTVAPYSLRARDHPTVSTPVTWQEVESCRRPADLVCTAPDVLDRVNRDGDLLAGLHDNPGRLPR
ncbi:non-homologous end-joining DNA ligase [Solihabitans fulvus]|nr:non-homologous end-joining DNA ligase [Solihabitans fulvus]